MVSAEAGATRSQRESTRGSQCVRTQLAAKGSDGVVTAIECLQCGLFIIL